MAVAPNEEEKGGTTPRSEAASRLAARRAAKAAAKAAKRGTAPVVPDGLAKGADAARSFYEDNSRLLLVGIGAGVLLAVVWLTVSAFLDKRAHEAGDLLFTGVEAAKAPVIDPATAGDLLDDSVETFPSEQARAKKAQSEYQVVLKRFPNTDAATWASLGEANALRDLGKQAEALKAYDQLLARKDDLSTVVRAGALEGAGFALESQSKYADATKRFGELAELANGAYKPLGEYHRARMLIAQGQKQKAAESLEALVKAERARPQDQGQRFEGVVSDAETLLTELSVELNAPKLRADIAPAAGPSSAAEQPNALTQDIVDALRRQIEQGKGQKGLDQKVIDALQQQVNEGASKPANDGKQGAAP
jgi:tetratricopeptide (TPR) repeat protein